MNLISRLTKPELDAPLQSWTPRLVAEGVNGHSYNIVAYGDFFWSVHWVEESFDIRRFLSGDASAPIIVGETVDEVTVGLEVMFPDKASGAPPLSEATECFEKVVRNVFCIRADRRAPLLAGTPGHKNAQLATVNLFQTGDGSPICIISPAPHRNCNYRCEYCYHHDHGFKKADTAFKSWRKAILTAVERIPRPLLLSMGTMGEPLYTPEWWDVAYKALKHPHVQRVAFVSNLSREIEPFLEPISPHRIGVAASLHPSEFKNHDHDLDFFLGQVSFIKDQGASIVVNYVLSPEQIDAYPGYRKLVNERGVSMTCNLMRGSYRGKTYPQAYDDEQLARIKEYHEEIPFIFEYQSHLKNPYGGSCTSGRYVFHLEIDGTLYNCQFARQKMGSIFDPVLNVRAENGYCTSFKCECKSTISLREDVVSGYRIQGNMHHFEQRPEKETGTHPFL